MSEEYKLINYGPGIIEESVAKTYEESKDSNVHPQDEDSQKSYKNKPKFFCKSCKVGFMSKKPYEKHNKTQQHKENLGIYRHELDSKSTEIMKEKLIDEYITREQE